MGLPKAYRPIAIPPELAAVQFQPVRSAQIDLRAYPLA